MTDKELKWLKWFAAGHSLLTEYNDEETWKAAFSLCKAGYLEGEGVITGTARFTVTTAGRKVIEP